MSTIVSDIGKENSNSNRCEGDVVLAPGVSCIIVVVVKPQVLFYFSSGLARPGSVINVNH